MNTAEQKLRKARAQVVLSHPFFGALLLKQQIEVGPVKTIATDGKTLYYNPAFIESCAPDELQAVCAHEALHPGLCHHLRQGDRSHALWNVACDYAINPILVEADFHLPEGALIRADLADKSAEEIFRELQNEQREEDRRDEQQEKRDQRRRDEGSAGENGDPLDDDEADQSEDDSPSVPSEDEDGDEIPEADDSNSDPFDDEEDDADDQGDASQRSESDDQPEDDADDQSEVAGDYGGCGCVLPAPMKTEPERQAEESEWKVALTQAANMARAHGTLPGQLERMIETMTAPLADWRDLLRRFMDQFAKADYSWQSPNRRMIANGLYLPSLRSEQMPPLLFVIDASGSMPQESLAQAASELQSIMSDLRPEWLDVVVHDTSVRHVERFDMDEDLSIKVQAGGGTYFGPVVDWIAEQDEEYACVLWFTDLCVGDIDRAAEIESPLIWIDYGSRGSAPDIGDEYVELNHD